MSTELIQLWNQAQSTIKERVGEIPYETWFSSLEAKQENEDTLILETPDDFYKNWVDDHYRVCVEEIVGAISTKPINIALTVSSKTIKNTPTTNVTSLKKESSSSSLSVTGINLNDRFTFDNFVLGSSNRIAYAAGEAVAEAPAKTYNPLFIYGQVGLGKTHLVQSIAHKIEQLYPEKKCRYMSSEQFMNDLISSIRHRSTEQFRKKYREIDVLLIDDIQFIAGKESTQEEFFHTFNNLHNNHKQIIITSDRPPKEISNLEERLSSRFAWGLAVDIQPPDFETRVAILRKKSENEKIHIPDDIILFIAEQIKTNIRELEGALIRVVAYSTLEDKAVSLETAQMVLKDMVRSSIKIISIEMIQKTVAGFFQIPLADLRSKRRNKNIVFPRQIAMFLSRKLTNMSLPEIGKAFEGRDHTTVLHSYKKIEKEMSSCENLQRTMQQLITTLKQ